MKYAYFNYIGEIQLSDKVVNMIAKSGDNTAAVQHCLKNRNIKKQFEKIDPLRLKLELKSYGAWDEAELNNHSENLFRLLWLAAWDIFDNIG